ncbi:Transcriptional regulator, TetR family [Fulvivirga imtechensis AK7]|uniref:Transcriptional regulator, TetR family n=1 Tax=Fulvivirga imtechensis AK7 TaxID=1237149 RepID=L8JSN1_9BACT|nr:TetR/AcrR family transcriptional regulator [Fulvivirga imtechensis]ELR70367.1 Transcriptional regulator, TetR family [Fulvivirga imtechensis AK7]
MPKHITFDREVVIKKVTELFWRKGYHGTSMQDLVDTTGLNRSSLYNTFGDKFALFLESMKYYQQQEQGAAYSHLFKSGSAVECIQSFFIALIDNIEEDKDKKGCYLINCTAELSATDPHVRDFLTDNQHSLIRAFTDLIHSGQQNGEIPATKDARHLALYLFSSLQGLRLTGMLNNSRKELEGIAEEIMSSLG